MKNILSSLTRTLSERPFAKTAAKAAVIAAATALTAGAGSAASDDADTRIVRANDAAEQAAFIEYNVDPVQAGAALPTVRTTTTTSYGAGSVTRETVTTEYYAAEAAPEFRPQQPVEAKAGGWYGPFRVVDARTVELHGSIDSDAPALFRRMLAANPGIETIRMIECPGSDDDAANLRLARMIRAAGISTHVPSYGSVRSGGVELFLAGVNRTADRGAEFAVHSWRDEDGMEARDYPMTAAVHQEYIGYYTDVVGMSYEKARAFYAMTNSVPYDSARYLRPADLAAYGLLDNMPSRSL